MNILKYILLLVWVIFIQFSKAEEATDEDYIAVVDKFLLEKYNVALDYKFRVVIDNVVYVYLDEISNNIPLRYLDSTFMIDKETKEIIYSNLRVKTDVSERYVDDEPLSIEEIPEFLNQLNYNGEYEIDGDSVEVVPKKKFNNYYDIENVPFLLIEQDNINTIEVEKVYEPITKNNSGNIFELAYYINYTDDHDNTYSIILFAYTRIVKKITKNGY
ncbi:hypothetical protein H8356DRAFT_1626271 [Neocallimastix lanati (nom. inval.)]|jgi:hypothetical protein|uniref:FTP domain-containing protein n=1 Tax=Neocallimastix californiae TaxID=1754190 RepID=A0A1Y2C9G7_9FUNG|nr:hypothetical protein H8356DRAFT_1626271 [Neocallimastix sp. JGI-2020a]ORY42955.1 hypothetical protein LY90DRAFT_703804 [Neocallimastix californiae]|eukprot:ORY42955.1 hypothetical protein LY90DRAFT_703804 [Neocallimastix californiae]